MQGVATPPGGRSHAFSILSYRSALIGMASRVSVVMAVYNAMPYLPSAVDSILRQTLSDFEFIIIDDGSTDGSTEYLRGLRDPRIRLERQANQGQQAAANRGIALAHGDLIARMDADDISMEDRLQKQVAFLDRHPEIGLTGGQILRLGSKRSGLPSNIPTSHQEIVEALMANRHGMCNGTTMFRKELFEKVGGYWEHNIAEDWDLFLRIAEVSQIANMEDVLLSARFHSQSINGRRIVEAQLYNEFAAELARRRARHQSVITFDEFRKDHRSTQWPYSWLFYLDCHSIGQYRVAIADIYNGQSLRGYARLLASMLMSPGRTFHRATNMLSRRRTLQLN